MPKIDLREEWEKRIADLKSSGMTHAKWCDANNVNIHQLKYWLRKIGGSHQSSKTRSKQEWVSLAIENESTRTLNESLQITVGSASIEVRPGFNPSFLMEVVKVLKHVK